MTSKKEWSTDFGTIPTVLANIVRVRQQRLLESAETLVAVPVQDGALRTAEDSAFLGALAAHRGRAVIAEVKMGSPRLGKLEGKVEPEIQAKCYAAAGAAALSVVVEPDFFYGSYELLARCKEACGLPAIAKDFVIDPIQVRWARRNGADAVLLIASLSNRERLLELASLTRSLDMVPLVEIHDEADLEKLDGVGWEMVGVNNRDLRTFNVNLHHGVALSPRLPEGALRVAESGIGSSEDLAELRAAGFDAFLIGESLLLSDDPEAKLQELLE